MARLARVTLRQLQWWDERGVVSPNHRGHRRFYGARDVLEILIISELRRKSLSFRKTRWAVTGLRRELDLKMRKGASPDSPLYLVTDLKTLHLEHRPERVVELSKAAGQPVYVVSIADQMNLLAAAKSTDKQLRLF